jgi:hypothetical protein
MPSPNDNISLKDGGDTPFKMRAKDVSVAQDGSLQAVRHLSSAYPVDYGTGGCFQMACKSASMAAGLASASPIFSFRNSSATMNLILRRLRMNAWSLGTGFTAGLATFDLFVARSFTLSDSGSSPISTASRNGALRGSAMASSIIGDLRVASTGTLTAGTRTLDANPIETWSVAAPSGTNTPFANNSMPVVLFERLADEHPLVLAQNEGFVVQATVPATGVWGFQITPAWDEVPLTNY